MHCIYYICYAQFCQGNNFHFHDEAAKFLSNTGITYAQNKISSKKIVDDNRMQQFSKKGFVYSLLTTRASNSIAYNIQQCTFKAYGEVLTSHKRAFQRKKGYDVEFVDILIDPFACYKAVKILERPEEAQQKKH
eukprot:2929397-Ditylum_brightwellii.AAC.1